MFRRLATSIDTGIDARTMWQREVNYAAPAAKAGMNQLFRAICDGDTVAASMRHCGLFPPLVYEMVKVGEKSGHLEIVFQQLSEHYENLIQLRRTFLTGIAWPSIEFFAAVVIFGLLILALGWAAMVTGSEPIDIFGLGLSPTGNFILYSFAIVLLLGGGAAFIHGTFRGWFGELPMKIAFRVPVLGSTIQNLALSRMAWSLGMAHNAGMDALETMSLGLRSTQIHYFMRHEQKVNEYLRAGNEMAVALRTTNAFPDEFIETLATGELTGQVTETMDRLSIDFRDRAKNQFRILAMIGGFLVMAFVAAILIFLIFYLFINFYLNPINEFADPNFRV